MVGRTLTAVGHPMYDKTKIDKVKHRRLHARAAFDAVARLSNDSRVVTCVIEDISANGARLRLEGDAAAHLFGEGWVLCSRLLGTIKIEIRWRNVDHAGVSFEVDREQRAEINRFVEALIRYAPSDAAHPAPQESSVQEFRVSQDGSG